MELARLIARMRIVRRTHGSGRALHDRKRPVRLLVETQGRTPSPLDRTDMSLSRRVM